MKTLPKILAVFLLAIIVIFSGCTGTSNQNEKNSGLGLRVVFFKAPAEVDSGEDFDVDLLVQNDGDNEAKDIQADLFQTSGIAILNSKVQAEQSLLPPDIEKGIQGEDKIFTWSMRAPNLAAEQTKSVQARIIYDYTSTATSNLYIVSKAELDEKGASAFPTYSTSSYGPATLSIVEMPPFKVKAGETSASVQVNLIIENAGPGRIVNSEVRDFAIVLKGEGTELDIISNCSDVIGGTLKLFGQEQQRAIRCNLDLPFSQTAVSYIVEAGINYTYSIDTNPFAIRIKAV